MLLENLPFLQCVNPFTVRIHVKCCTWHVRDCDATVVLVSQHSTARDNNYNMFFFSILQANLKRCSKLIPEKDLNLVIA